MTLQGLFDLCWEEQNTDLIVDGFEIHGKTSDMCALLAEDVLGARVKEINVADDALRIFVTLEDE